MLFRGEPATRGLKPRTKTCYASTLLLGNPAGWDHPVIIDLQLKALLCGIQPDTDLGGVGMPQDIRGCFPNCKTEKPICFGIGRWDSWRFHDHGGHTRGFQHVFSVVEFLA